MAKKADLNVLFSYPKADQPTFDIIPIKVPEYLEVECPNKITPLIFGIIFSNFKLAKDLLRNCASPNTPDSEGVSPLMYAARLVSTRLILIMFYELYCFYPSGKRTFVSPLIINPLSMKTIVFVGNLTQRAVKMTQ